jgi:hypothetical protein
MIEESNRVLFCIQRQFVDRAEARWMCLRKLLLSDITNCVHSHSEMISRVGVQ